MKTKIFTSSEEDEKKEELPAFVAAPLNSYILPLAIVLAVVILAGAWVYTSQLKYLPKSSSKNDSQSQTAKVNSTVSATDDLAALEDKVLPAAGVILPVRWGNLGAQLIKTGVIDQAKFEALYQQRGLSEADKKLWLSEDNGSLLITPENYGLWLNLLWALGLASKNEILENGPMMDERYGGAGNFASTGGWTISQGDAMNHYSKHQFITLTAEEQQLVTRVSQGIFRPCCGNAVYFPDCNHGMAMLGLLELMASQGVSEQEMYQAALAVNAYWFPDTYLTIAKYLKGQGRGWQAVKPQEILGYDYSSAAGYRQILTQVEPATTQGGGGCGV